MKIIKQMIRNAFIPTSCACVLICVTLICTHTHTHTHDVRMNSFRIICFNINETEQTLLNLSKNKLPKAVSVVFFLNREGERERERESIRKNHHANSHTHTHDVRMNSFRIICFNINETEQTLVNLSKNKLPKAVSVVFFFK